MDAKVLDEVAALIAGELAEDGEDLDLLEHEVTRAMQQIAQRALQKKLEGKKGATEVAGSTVGADRKPDSSPTGTR